MTSRFPSSVCVCVCVYMPLLDQNRDDRKLGKNCGFPITVVFLFNLVFSVLY